MSNNFLRICLIQLVHIRAKIVTRSLVLVAWIFLHFFPRLFLYLCYIAGRLHSVLTFLVHARSDRALRNFSSRGLWTLLLLTVISLRSNRIPTSNTTATRRATFGSTTPSSSSTSSSIWSNSWVSIFSNRVTALQLASLPPVFAKSAPSTTNSRGWFICQTKLANTRLDI